MNTKTSSDQLRQGDPQPAPKRPLELTLSGGALQLTFENLTRPFEHLEVAPHALQAALFKLIEQAPLLLGDELYESLEEPHAALNLERQLSARIGQRCALSPHVPQKSPLAPPKKATPQAPLDVSPQAPHAPSCLIVLASQKSFLSPASPRVKQGLREALSLIFERFDQSEELKLALLVSDHWDARFMRDQRAQALHYLKTRGQVLIPTLHHGGLLTPICYL